VTTQVAPARAEPPEHERERLDRELIEFLNELRVALPGVQVLFAFLLTVPFASGFARVSDLQRHVYFVTLLLTAFACACLIAPTAYHRIRFRQRDKRHLLALSNRFALAGLGLLALAMSSTVLLVTDVIFDTTVAGVIAAIVALVFASAWFVLPLVRRFADEDGDGTTPQ
jgi:hypothetical protein